MSPNRKKAIFIQLSAAVTALFCVFTVILYARGVFDLTFIDRPVTEDTSSPDSTEPPQDTEPQQDNIGIDAVVPETEQRDDGSLVFPNYDEAVAALPTYDNVKASGKDLYEGLYTSSSVLAKVTSSADFSEYYALRDMKSTTITGSQIYNGAYLYTETETTVPRPVLQVYYGFILRDDGKTVKLCDSKGNVLQSDISAYETVGHRDLAGHPLFKKDGKYYYYYDPKNPDPDTVVADQITAETIWQFTTELPACYTLITADSEITPTLPATAGMVECTVDENYFSGVKVNSSYEETAGKDPESFRLCERRITRVITNQAEIDRVNALIAQQQAAIAGGTSKGNQTVDTTPITPVEPIYKETDEGTFWGFIDKDGNFIHYPQFAMAYDFSTNGLAVVTDSTDAKNQRTAVINKSGTLVVNAWRSLLYIVERGNTPVRDGHYLPDTYGIESIGMLSYNNSLLRVRRRLLDTANGYTYTSEKDVLIDTNGKIFNIPAGYTLKGYSDGILLLEKNGHYGYMNRTGRWIVQPRYTYAEPFSEGLAVVGFANGARCMIDTNGNIVLPMVYTYISQCSNGVVVAFSNEHGWTIYNKMDTAEYTEQSNPILTYKKRILAQAAYDASLTQAN